MNRRERRAAAPHKDDTSGPRAARAALLHEHQAALLAAGEAHLSAGGFVPFVVALADRRDPMGAELHQRLDEAGHGTGEDLVVLVVDRAGFGALLDAVHSEVAAHFHGAHGASFAAVVASGGVTLQALTLPAPGPARSRSLN